MLLVGLRPALQWQNGIYGVVGTHVATQVGGRLQVFTAPGVMLLNVPGPNGILQALVPLA